MILEYFQTVLELRKYCVPLNVPEQTNIRSKESFATNKDPNIHIFLK